MLTETVLPSPRPLQRDRTLALRRYLELFKTSAQFMGALLWDRITHNRSAQRRHRRAQWLVQQLLGLGPTFIKIGQSLSTRTDLLPLEYIQALSQLQDQVPAFATQEAMAAIESELGRSLSDLFGQFDPEPLASASLGQVHRAILLSGEEVVVKVQRPGLEALFYLDFEVIHQLLWLARSLLPGIKKYNLDSIYQEFSALLFQEIDYLQEGKNADRFRQNFANQPRILVPTVYWQYTTHKILTLEYLPGIKVNDRETLQAKGINVDRVIQLGICAYLKQLLLDGFFQSDPHPGNMAVTNQGELIFYDFGTMAEVKVLARDRMIQSFFAVLSKDTTKLMETLVFMGLIEPTSNMGAVQRIINFLLDNFRDKPVDVRAFEQMSEEVVTIFEQQPFRVPPQMMFVLKSLMTLDGIARTLDPAYNLLTASQPFVRSVTASQGRSSLLKGLALGTQNFMIKQWQKPKAASRLIEQLESRIEQGDLLFRVRSEESDRLYKLIYLALQALLYACLLGFSVVTGAILLGTIWIKWSTLCFALAGLWGLLLGRSLIRLKLQERIVKLSQK